MIELKLAEALEAKGRSLLSLANETGVSYNTLHRLQSGKAEGLRYDTLSAICAALGCQPGDLLFYKAEGKARSSARKKSEPKK